MVSLQDVPTDYNFTSWGSEIASRAKDACGPLAFRSVKGRMGASLFESLSHPDGKAAITKMLDPDYPDYSMGGYLGERWQLLLVVILSIFAILVLILASLGVSKRVRRFYSEKLCGLCKAQPRVRLSHVDDMTSFKLWFFSALACIVFCCGAGFLFAGVDQIRSEYSSVECNMWLQLHGHFSGADGIDLSQAPEISGSWRGTLQIVDALNELSIKVQGGPENPIYQHLYQGMQALKVETEAQAGDMTALLTDCLEAHSSLGKFSDVYNTDQEEALKGLYGASNKYLLRFPLHAVFAEKFGEFVDEINTTLSNAWLVIGKALEVYAGESAELMNNGRLAVEQSLETIGQVDTMLAQLVKMWDHMSGLSGALITFILTVICIAGILVFTVIPFSGFLCFRMHRNLRHNVLPKASTVRNWKATFVMIIVTTIFLILSAMFTFVLGTAGNDACLMVKQEVLEEGRWELLGPDILNPPELGSSKVVDVNIVLDTCVKIGGGGDVAVALGLDAAIAEMSDDVDDAVAVTKRAAEALLLREYQTTRLNTLGLMVQETVRSNDRAAMHLENNPAGFDGFRALVLEERNVEEDGGSVFLIAIPEYTNTNLVDLAQKFFSQGLYTNVGTVGDAYKLIHEIVDRAVKIDPTGDFPRSFCGFVGEVRGYCAQGSGTVDLGSKDITGAELDEYANKFDAVFNPTDITDPEMDAHSIGAYGPARMGERIGSLLRAIVAAEWMATTPFASLKWNDSSEAKDFFLETLKEKCFPEECNFLDFFEAYDSVAVSRSRELKSKFTHLLETVDAYTYGDVIPTMQRLVSDANDIVLGSNCQFEGSALAEGVVPVLCEGVLPGAALIAMLCGVGAILMVLYAVHFWEWVHYIVDIVEANLDPESYLSSETFSPMSKRSEFVQYTGLPSANNHVNDNESTVADVEVGANAPVVLAEDVNHNKEAASFVSASSAGEKATPPDEETRDELLALPGQLIPDETNLYAVRRGSALSGASYLSMQTPIAPK